MNSKGVSIKLSDGEIHQIENLLRNTDEYRSKTDFIRLAVRQKLDEIKKENPKLLLPESENELSNSSLQNHS